MLRRPHHWILPLLVLRAWGRIYYFDFWAEDGKTFVTQALSDGLISIPYPLAASYQVIQRLVAYLTIKFFPVAVWPLVVTVFCVLATAWVFSGFARGMLMNGWSLHLSVENGPRFYFVLPQD